MHHKLNKLQHHSLTHTRRYEYYDTDFHRKENY